MPITPISPFPGDNGALTTVQRRQERQRQRVFEEASRLFEENGGESGRGYEDTTVEAIAQRADISPRTFFRLFEAKVDVIYLDMKRSMAWYFQCLERRLGEQLDPLTAALLARLDQISAFAREPVNVLRLRRSLRSPHFVNRRAIWHSQWQTQLCEVLTPHLPASDEASTRAALIAALVVKVGEVGLVHWESRGGQGDPAVAIAKVYLMMDDLLDINREAIASYATGSAPA